MKKKLTIVRTATGSTVVAGFIRLLQKHRVRVIGVDPDPRALGKYICDAFFAVPWGRSPAFAEKLLRICKKVGARAVISGPEEETLALSRAAERFERNGIRMFFTDPKTIAILQDKVQFSTIASRLGLAVPRIYEAAEIPKVPYLIKPRRGRGSQDIRIVRTRKNAEIGKTHFRQEYIGGTEYSVDCFFDKNHQPLLLVPRARMKTESGVSVISRTLRHPAIEKEVRMLASALRFVGPFCIQLIEKGSKRYYIDCNHRFGGASILSVHSTPKFMKNFLALMAGRKYRAGETNFTSGMIMQRYYEEIYRKG